ncbi:XRE family transcriptional regulator [Nonomuraea glycinis]|uniref:Transcriptional regulator n=1 Tax=Nonomuraea glycinis TaxID=2047744 RepID=A0A918E9P0_9ACTN|nr:XRE family transcriptional regulator [Nonomuraea glycinis]MCA2182793.1 XRE family transcriptional regulator [Nonomuraea glycinis]GGP17185.1 transcriptional regulator [Nonomuraea glycinis]
MDGSTLQAALGKRLRQLREERAMNAAELARASGVARATLSKLEAGHGNPTLDTIGALAAALRLPLVDLLAELTTPPVRLDRSPPVSDPTPSQHLLTRVGGSGMTEFWRLRLGPGQRLDRQPHATGTTEHITVITGNLKTGPTDNLQEMTAGDFISYRADIPHSYVAGADGVHAAVVMTYLLALPDFAP